MANFVRLDRETLTLLFEIDRAQSAKVLNEDSLKRFMEELDQQKLSDKKMFISLSFINGFDEKILKRIQKLWQAHQPFIDVDIQVERLVDYFQSLPNVDRCTLVGDGWHFLDKHLLKKTKKQPTAFTVLRYIKVDDIDKAIDYFSKIHKQFPHLEIVLHPDPEQAKDKSLVGQFETLRMDGYFPPQEEMLSERPESMRINYKYSDVDLSPREIKVKGLNQFKGYQCFAGREHLYIKSNGEVWPSACGGLSKIAEKNMKDYQWPSEVFVCNKEVCTKTDDILISKIQELAE